MRKTSSTRKGLAKNIRVFYTPAVIDVIEKADEEFLMADGLTLAEPVVEEAARRLFRMSIARMQARVVKAYIDSVILIGDAKPMHLDVNLIINVKDEADKFLRYMEAQLPPEVSSRFSRDSVELAMQKLLEVVCRHTHKHFMTMLNREAENIQQCARTMGDDMLQGVMVVRSVIDKAKPKEEYN